MAILDTNDKFQIISFFDFSFLALLSEMNF